MPRMKRRIGLMAVMALTSASVRCLLWTGLPPKGGLVADPRVI